MARTIYGNLVGRAARRELIEQIEAAIEERRERIRKARAEFEAALDELKAADPDWEAWYDDNDNVPVVLRWAEPEIWDVIERIRRRARELV